MMEVYIMKGQMDTQYGQILIDTDVIATYAGSVAVEVLWNSRHGSGQHEGWSCKAF